MSEQNKEIVRRVYQEIFDSGNIAAVDNLFASDVIIHDPITGDAQGIEAYRQLANVFLTGFPRQNTDLQIFVAEGEYVGVFHTHHATNSGSFLGMPPTGKTVAVNGLELYRIQNSRIVEFWRHDDDAGLMQQLGLIPQLSQPAQ
jgi:steroid delta-isomerase-like uncharacterized protein